MNRKRNIEVFSSGCSVCNEAVDLVNRLACDSCEISVLDMHDAQIAERARELGIRSVPAVAIVLVVVCRKEPGWRCEVIAR